jgi:hypothetical protein
MRILGIVALGVALSGCAIQRAQVAQDARAQMVGMSKEQVLTCMGPPATKAAEGQTEVWAYNSGDGTTFASGSVSGGSFSGVSSSRFCRINLVMASGAVSAVNYQGPTGGLITAGEQCAYAVDACVRPRWPNTHARLSRTEGEIEMNRSSLITLVGFGIVLILAIFSSVNGHAQDQRITQLRKAYQDCVYDAVASQIRAGQMNNASAAIELAFQACATEEQAILAHVYAAGVSAVDANQAITGFKLSLKQNVREILARPQRDVSQPSSAPNISQPYSYSTPPDIRPPRGCTSSYKRYDGATVYTNCN